MIVSDPPIPRRRVWFASMVALAILPADAAKACGRDSDCAIGDRAYRIALPESRASGAPLGAIVFAHRYRGTAERVMRNAALAETAERLGVALIAARAAGVEWSILGDPAEDIRAGIDEAACFDALAADAAERFGVDRDRILVAGFSSGAMMVWRLACQRGDAFAGFAPMSGAFWAPAPADRPAGAVNLIHYHGHEERVAPLRGRPIKDSRQGDVYAAMELMRRVGGYGPATTTEVDGLRCERRSNPAGKLLELCLFTGKHMFEARRLERAWRPCAAANGW